MSTTAKNKNLSTVKAIGAAERRAESAVVSIVAGLPEGFDPSVRGAITDAIHTWAVGTDERPAVKVGPKGNQRATDYGRGVDALAKAVKRALSADEPKPVRLAVTLSGDGVDGGTFVVPTDHPLYAALTELVASATASDES